MSTRIDRERQQFALREARTYQSKGGLDEVVGAVEGAALRVRQQGLPQVLTIWERGGRAGDYGAGEVAGLVHRWLTKGAPGDRLVAADALALVEALETASPAEVGTAELEVIEFLVQLKTILHGFAVARKRAASGAEQPRRSRTLDRQQGELDPDGGQSRDRNPPRGLPPVRRPRARPQCGQGRNAAARSPRRSRIRPLSPDLAREPDAAGRGANRGRVP
jgi:hypothetical protein